jgi:16S rRNA (guanine1207-N2)-methyltransferase
MAERHYFDAQPEVASRPAEVSLSLPEGEVRLRTDRGVFSVGRVDPGTTILLRAALGPSSLCHGNLLDLGCGYGPIAVTLARRAPHATVWAVDVNERALDLTRENATALGLANVRVATPSAVPSDVRFDEIWSNPPIRIGKDALHELLLTWLGRLQPGGRSLLVVQKHLGGDSLATWLTEQGYPTTRLRSKQAYRVLEVVAPGSAPDPAAELDPALDTWPDAEFEPWPAAGADPEPGSLGFPAPNPGQSRASARETPSAGAERESDS